MTLVGAFIVMLFVHTQLAIMTFLVVPILIWLGFYFNHKMTLAFRQMYADIGDFNARVEDNIGGRGSSVFCCFRIFCSGQSRKSTR